MSSGEVFEREIRGEGTAPLPHTYHPAPRASQPCPNSCRTRGNSPEPPLIGHDAHPISAIELQSVHGDGRTSGKPQNPTDPADGIAKTGYGVDPLTICGYVLLQALMLMTRSGENAPECLVRGVRPGVIGKRRGAV